MFERFTERARRVLFFARYEASQLGSISIETEHMLLGLIREGKGITSRIFAAANVSLTGIRRQIEGRTVFREKISTSVEIPFSAEVKRVLQFSADEADRLQHHYIGTEHLLLGLLREERSVAAAVLKEAGLSLEQVRDHITTLLSERAPRDRGVDRAGADTSHSDHPFFSFPVPLYVPSSVVHISVNRHGLRRKLFSVGQAHWLVIDARLDYVVARAHQVRDEQVKLADGRFDRLSFDVALALPWERGDGEPAETLVLKALEEQLRVRITRETTSEGDMVTVRPVD